MRLVVKSTLMQSTVWSDSSLEWLVICRVGR